METEVRVVDRAARDRLIEGVRAYFAGGVGTGKFVESVEGWRTEDRTAETFRVRLVTAYADVHRERAVITRAGWESQQAWLLLLRTDAHLVAVREPGRRLYGWRHVLAAAGIVAYVWLVWMLWGHASAILGVSWCVGMVFFGVVIWGSRGKGDERGSGWQTFRELRRLHRLAPRYRKGRHREEWAPDDGSRILRWGGGCLAVCVLSMVGPGCLLLLAVLPDNRAWSERLMFDETAGEPAG